LGRSAEKNCTTPLHSKGGTRGASLCTHQIENFGGAILTCPSSWFPKRKNAQLHCILKGVPGGEFRGVQFRHARAVGFRNETLPAPKPTSPLTTSTPRSPTLTASTDQHTLVPSPPPPAGRPLGPGAGGCCSCWPLGAVRCTAPHLPCNQRWPPPSGYLGGNTRS
jgi:hypothetical protein